jgi:hypothetical protein
MGPLNLRVNRGEAFSVWSDRPSYSQCDHGDHSDSLGYKVFKIVLSQEQKESSNVRPLPKTYTEDLNRL